MAIKRLTREAPSFPFVGKLRKGAAKPATGNVPGKDLDHFRFDTQDNDAMSRFAAVYGKEPKEINVYLPFDTAEENFQVWQEAYVTGGLKHRCDGETCVIWQKQDGTYSQEPKPCPGGCKEVGRLMVIIPELARMAYVTVETHSINDILQLTANLQAAQAMRGTLKGMPMLLTRRAKEISTPGEDGKRKRYVKWLLFIEPDPDWVRVQLDAMRRIALTAPDGFLPLPEHRQLADGRTVDVRTGEIIEDDDDEVTYDVYEEAPVIQPAKPAINGKAPTDYPLEWRNPMDAQKWATDNGHCANGHEANNSWINTVKDCGGFDAKKNGAQVYASFYAKHTERAAVKGEPVPELTF